MILLIAGIALFFAAHGLKIHMPSPRAKLVSKFGQGPVRLIMTVLMIGAVAMIVVGYQQAPFINVWYPPAWAYHLNNLLMLIAIVVFISAGPKSWIADKIRHPQLIGTKIWSVAHLLVNGDLASIVLFGGLLAWAVSAMIGVNKRDGKSARTPTGTLLGTAINLVAGVVLMGAVGWVHNYFGVWPFGGRS
ncbi:MAG: NnrU family protein [Pseudomonadota bacterium]